MNLVSLSSLDGSFDEVPLNRIGGASPPASRNSPNPLQRVLSQLPIGTLELTTSPRTVHEVQDEQIRVIRARMSVLVLDPPPPSTLALQRENARVSRMTDCGRDSSDRLHDSMIQLVNNQTPFSIKKILHQDFCLTFDREIAKEKEPRVIELLRLIESCTSNTSQAIIEIHEVALQSESFCNQLCEYLECAFGEKIIQISLSFSRPILSLGSIVKASSFLKKLQIHATNSELDDAIVSLVESAPSIKKLILRGAIQNRLLAKLPPLLTGLEALDISGCTEITDSGLSELLTRCTSIHSLELDNCNITDHLLEELVRTNHRSRSISLLSLKETRITDEGIRSLGDLTYLRALDVRNCTLLAGTTLEGVSKVHFMASCNIQGCPLIKKEIVEQLRFACVSSHFAEPKVARKIAEFYRHKDAIVDHFLTYLATYFPQVQVEFDQEVLTITLKLDAAALEPKAMNNTFIFDEIVPFLASHTINLTCSFIALSISSTLLASQFLREMSPFLNRLQLTPDPQAFATRAQIKKKWEFPKLYELDLTSCPITEQELALLSCPTLRKLSLRGCRYITANILTLLHKQFSLLHHLDLKKGPPLPSAQAGRFQNHMPKLEKFLFSPIKPLEDGRHIPTALVLGSTKALSSLPSKSAKKLRELALSQLRINNENVLELLKHAAMYNQPLLKKGCQAYLEVKFAKLFQLDFVGDCFVLDFGSSTKLVTIEQKTKADFFEIFRKFSDQHLIDLRIMLDHPPEEESKVQATIVELFQALRKSSYALELVKDKKSATFMSHFSPRKTDLPTTLATPILNCCSRNTLKMLQLSSVELSVLELLKEFRSIHTLSLNGCSLSPVSYVRNLQALSLTNNPSLTRGDLEQIVERHPDLEELSLAGCKNISDDTVALLSSRLRNLRYLDLSGCKISDRALKPETFGMPKLIYLSLADTPITADGLKDLALLSRPLRHLVLDRTKVDSGALLSMKMTFPLIERLSLDQCLGIDDRALKLVAENFELLRFLSVRGCEKIGPTGLIEPLKRCQLLATIETETCELLRSFDLHSGTFEIDAAPGILSQKWTLLGHRAYRAKSVTIVNGQQLTKEHIANFFGALQPLPERPGPLRLTRLEIVGFKLDDSYLHQQIGRNVPSLEKLVYHGPCTPQGAIQLVKLEKLKSLTLSCEQGQQSGPTDEHLELFSLKFSHLQSLALKNFVSLTHKGIGHILKNCKELATLHIANCPRVQREPLNLLAANHQKVRFIYEQPATSS